MRNVKRDSLTVGDSVYIIERGEYSGPFTVARLSGGRTPEHVILSGRSGLFEQYADNYSLFTDSEA